MAAQKKGPAITGGLFSSRCAIPSEIFPTSTTVLLFCNIQFVEQGWLLADGILPVWCREDIAGRGRDVQLLMSWWARW